MLWLAGICGAVGLLLHLLLVEVWTVPRGDPSLLASIVPGLQSGDTLLVLRGRAPRPGELGRCASPLAQGAYVLGRVFGEPGDRVEVTERGQVRVNGKALGARRSCGSKVVPHPVTQNLVTLSCSVAESGPSGFEFLTHGDGGGGGGVGVGGRAAVVEAGKLFLVSDNRGMHQDSRDFGLVEASRCERVAFRLWGERYADASRRFTLLW